MTARTFLSGANTKRDNWAAPESPAFRGNQTTHTGTTISRWRLHPIVVTRVWPQVVDDIEEAEGFREQVHDFVRVPGDFFLWFRLSAPRNVL